MRLRDVLPIMQRRILDHTTYRGIPTLRNPIDYWVYQELLWKIQPDVIVELGNRVGGGLVFFSDFCDRMGHGKVIGVDIRNRQLHHRVISERITTIKGNAVDSFYKVKAMINRDDRVMVFEDSSHTFDNTLAVLCLYSKLLQVGDYIIVEDGICNHGLKDGPKPGPYEAIEAFMDGNEDFEIDRTLESFLITWNPKGYIKRIR